MFLWGRTPDTHRGSGRGHSASASRATVVSVVYRSCVGAEHDAACPCRSVRTGEPPREVSLQRTVFASREEDSMKMLIGLVLAAYVVTGLGWETAQASAQSASAQGDVSQEDVYQEEGDESGALLAPDTTTAGTTMSVLWIPLDMTNSPPCIVRVIGRVDPPLPGQYFVWITFTLPSTFSCGGRTLNV